MEREDADTITVPVVDGLQMRILFFSHYFPPEVNAPATRTYEHCVRWARAGHDVIVVTCVPNCPDGVVYEGYRNMLRWQVETVDGVRVVRVWTYLAPNAGTARRILNYLSYMASAVLASLWLPKTDVVMATSPQFFCGWAGVIVSWLRRAPLILEIRDIWPESIEAVGAIRCRWLLRLLEWLERSMYRSATRVVTVGPGYRDKILEKVSLSNRITIIPNGVDLRRFTPRAADPRFLHIWDLEGKFVCSYVGTIGMAHGLEVVLKAANILKSKGRHDIAFCLVGDGAERERLEQLAKQWGLEGLVVFAGKQPKESIPDILASSDACLVHLKKSALFETVIPSKIFEMMAMRRPIIMGVKGAARDIAMQARAGIEMESDSAEDLVSAVERLADDPELTANLGRVARHFVARNYDRNVFALKCLELLGEITGQPAVRPAAPAPTKEPAPLREA